MKAFAACFDCGNFVDHVLARHHFAKHGIAPTLHAGCFVVQKVVVSHVDEELSGGRVRVGCARHGDGVVVVFEPVVGFVLDRLVTVFLAHAGLETAALHHEAWNDAVKNGVVVVTFVHIVQEVLGALGGLFTVEFEGDDAEVRDVQFDLWVAHGGYP